VLTYWGCEKNPACTQINTARVIFNWNPFLVDSTIVAAYVTALFQPGLGLTDSFGSDKTYLGAGWNVNPVPTLESVPWQMYLVPYLGNLPFAVAPYVDVFWSRFWTWGIGNAGHLMTVTAAGFVGTMPMIDTLMTTMMLLVVRLYFTMFLHLFSNPSREESLRKSHEMTSSTPPKPGRVFGYPESRNFLFRKSFWKTTIKYEFFFDAPIMAAYGPYGLAIASSTVYYLIFHPAFLTEDSEDGIIKWLNLCHVSIIVQAVYLGMFMPIWQKFIIFPHIYRQLESGRHLSSAAAFKTRIDGFKDIETGIIVTSLLMVLAYSVLMPYGMALQAYGISERSSWPSPLNFVFNQEGSAFNMLGAPIHTLVCKFVFLLVTMRWFDVKPEQPPKTAKPALKSKRAIVGA